MDAECPIYTADLADTFIHHSGSLGGSLVASSAPGGIGRGDFGKARHWILERAQLPPKSTDRRSRTCGAEDVRT